MTPRQKNDSSGSGRYRRLQQLDPDLTRKLNKLIGTDGLLQKRYRLEVLIGAGGFGQIHKARDLNTRRKVAVKMMHLPGGERQRRRINYEATIPANLRHPVLPAVFDYFSVGGLQFIVMEFIEGDDLEKLLKRNTFFPMEQIFRWAHDLLDVLDYLHTQSKPIIHRDTKPSNIICTKRGNVVLLDFGLAKGEADSMLLLPDTRMTVLSVPACTEAYAPLEQLNHAGTDETSDIFSLTATLYHLFTGQRPRHTAAERWRAIWKGGPDPLPLAHTLNPAISLRLSEVLARGMAIDFKERFASAAEMRLELAEAHSEMAKKSEDIERAARIIRAGQIEEAPKATNEKIEPIELSTPTHVAQDEERSTLQLPHEDEKPQTRPETKPGTGQSEEEAAQLAAPEVVAESVAEEEAAPSLAEAAPQLVFEAVAPSPEAEEEAPVEVVEEILQPAAPVSLERSAPSIETPPLNGRAHWLRAGLIAALLLLLTACAFIGLWLSKQNKPSQASYTQPAVTDNASRPVQSGTEGESNSSQDVAKPDDDEPSEAGSDDAGTVGSKPSEAGEKDTGVKDRGVEARPSATPGVPNANTTRGTSPPRGRGPGTRPPEPSPVVSELARKQKRLLAKLVGPTRITFGHPDRFGAVAKYNEGIEYLDAGKFDEAAESFEIASGLKENFIEALINWGNAEAKDGNLDRAHELYDEALEAYKVMARRRRNPLFKPLFLDQISFDRGIVYLSQKVKAEEEFKSATAKRERADARQNIEKFEQKAEQQCQELEERESSLAPTLCSMIQPDKRRGTQPDKRQPPQPRQGTSVNATTRNAGTRNADKRSPSVRNANTRSVNTRNANTRRR